MCIAAGNVSFDDCDIFTSSFRMNRLLAAHFAAPQSESLGWKSPHSRSCWSCVPLPVCQMRRGKCSFNFPEMTSSAACVMRLAFSSGSFPRSRFTSAAAFFKIAESANQFRRHGVLANGEMNQRTRRLSAVVAVHRPTSILPMLVGFGAGGDGTWRIGVASLMAISLSAMKR